MEYHLRKSTKSPTTTVAIVLIVILSFLDHLQSTTGTLAAITESSNKSAKSKFVCVPGLYTWGATYPQGDIMLEEGDTLRVNCTVDLDHSNVKGLNSSNIKFSFTKHDIPEELLETTVIDNSTAMLVIRNMNVSTPFLYCLVQDPVTNKEKHVCQNQIDVGYKPQEVQNLKCVARNWESLNCTWTKPPNNVFTSYSISYLLNKYLMTCIHKVELNKTVDSCEWNGKSGPSYNQNLQEILIVVNGTNVLKPEGTIWKYRFHHWEIVIPSKPDVVSVQRIESNRVELRWSFTKFELFKAGLDHRITICMTEELNQCVISDFQTIKLTHLTKEIFLPYAYTKYKVEIRMKSQKAKDEPEFWSPPAVQEIMTHPKKPEMPPDTAIGSFEIFDKYQVRDIYVYWQRVPVFLRNGSNFHYEFRVYEDGVIQRDIVPEIRESSEYAVFMNLSRNSYRIEINSVNSEGRSEQSAVFFIPSSEMAPKGPVDVSKVDYLNGTYVISWRHPPIHENLISYTVYKCKGTKSLCDELLDWVDVGPENTHYVYHNLLGEKDVHQYVFGVSANTGNMSSGMIIANCELVSGKVLGKLSLQQSYSNENEIEVKWKLDCSFKRGLVQGFRLTYCKSKPIDECSDRGRKNESLANENSTSHILRDLEPFSTYTIWISMVTHAGESQSSDPILVNTTEAAPSDPPKIVQVQVSNISATITIESPRHPNGVVRNYEIVYSRNDLTSSEHPVEESIKVLNDMEYELFEINVGNYNITNLVPNANYSVKAKACTTFCSVTSDPVYLHTKTGYTHILSTPSLSYEDGQIQVAWERPKHLGGPVEYFEVMVQKNGQLVDELDSHKVSYLRSLDSYTEKVSVNCESNTNITARVRAVTLIDDVKLYGDWSPEGSFNCYAVSPLVIWILITVSLVTGLMLLGFLSLKCRDKWIKVTHFDINPPPGMEQLRLNGFTEIPPTRVRQNSDGDTRPFGKDLDYQTKILNTPPEESKEFLFDSSKESKEGSPITQPGTNSLLAAIAANQANGSSPLWWWHRDHVSDEDDLLKPKFYPTTNNIEDSDPIKQAVISTDELLENGLSTSNPRLFEENYDGEDHYRTVGYMDQDKPMLNGFGETPPQSDEDSTTDDVNSNPSDGPSSFPLTHNNNNNRMNPDIPPTYNNILDSNENSNPSTNQNSDSILPTNYVQWTYKTDPVMGEHDHHLRSPYFQVEILPS